MSLGPAVRSSLVVIACRLPVCLMVWLATAMVPRSCRPYSLAGIWTRGWVKSKLLLSNGQCSPLSICLETMSMEKKGLQNPRLNECRQT